MDRQINIFCYANLHSSDDRNDFINKIHTIFNEIILLDNSYDSYIDTVGNPNKIFLQQINDIVKKNNNRVIVISISDTSDPFLLSLTHFKFISFPLAALYGVFSKIGENNIKTYYNDIKKNYLQSPKYFLKCLNHNRNKSRIIMIDLLEKNKLLQDPSTLYSWNAMDTYDEDIPDFKYYSGEYRKVDDVIGKWDSQYVSPILKRNSILHLIGETSHLIDGFTEKTFKPIVYGEFFILYGVKNQNRSLAEFGFKIFDNIIDYEFDQISDEQNGIEKIVSQVKKLKNIPITQILNKTIDSVLYNSELSMSIFKNKKYLPNILKTNTNMKIYSISQNLRPICMN